MDATPDSAFKKNKYQSNLPPLSQTQKTEIIQHLQGKVYEQAKDQHGCRYLQRLLDYRDQKITSLIFEEIFPHIIELMMDSFGNYLCQKVIEVCDSDQRLRLVQEVKGSLVEICLNLHGTRAVQKLIDGFETQEQVDIIIDSLRAHVVDLSKDLNGNHVIQRCLHRLSSENLQFIYDSMATNCVDIATHRHGCCVFQRCIDFASAPQLDQIVRNVKKHVLKLVKDPFGNYVVQYILDVDFPEGTLVSKNGIVAALLGNLAELSVQKFSSNVVEKCIRVADLSLRKQLIDEVMNDETLPKLLQDPYGNYVIQTSLSISDATQFQNLVDGIHPHLNNLKNSPYGKKIQTKIMREINSSNRRGTGAGNSERRPNHRRGNNNNYSGNNPTQGGSNSFSEPGNSGGNRGGYRGNRGNRGGYRKQYGDGNSNNYRGKNDYHRKDSHRKDPNEKHHDSKMMKNSGDKKKKQHNNSSSSSSSQQPTAAQVVAQAAGMKSSSATPTAAQVLAGTANVNSQQSQSGQGQLQADNLLMNPTSVHHFADLNHQNEFTDPSSLFPQGGHSLFNPRMSSFPSMSLGGNVQPQMSGQFPQTMSPLSSVPQLGSVGMTPLGNMHPNSMLNMNMNPLSLPMSMQRLAFPQPLQMPPSGANAMTGMNPSMMNFSSTMPLQSFIPQQSSLVGNPNGLNSVSLGSTSQQFDSVQNPMVSNPSSPPPPAGQNEPSSFGDIIKSLPSSSAPSAASSLGPSNASGSPIFGLVGDNSDLSQNQNNFSSEMFSNSDVMALNGSMSDPSQVGSVQTNDNFLGGF